MARLTLCSAALALAWTAACVPAAAQFNPFEALFGPPRPQRDVPSRAYPPSERLPPGPPPSQYPQQYPQQYPPAARLPPGPPPGYQPPPDYPTQPGYQTQPLPPPGAQRPPQRPRDAVLAPGTPPPPAETVITPSALKITHPTAVLSGLDKVTGRIITFDVTINETVQFGALQVTPRACYTRPPSETPTTDSFMEVDEVTLQGEVRRIFTGWMFAASPGLHAVEHAIYDVWLVDCKGGATQVAESPEPTRPAQQRQPRQQQPQPQRPRPPAPTPAPTLPPPIR